MGMITTVAMRIARHWVSSLPKQSRLLFIDSHYVDPSALFSAEWHAEKEAPKAFVFQRFLTYMHLQALSQLFTPHPCHLAVAVTVS